jgi:hypothetical protein
LWRNVLLPFPAVLLLATLLGVLACDNTFGGDPVEAITFQQGPVSGVPAYPGGTQLTGALNLNVPAEMRQFVGSGTASWAVYRTGDAVEDITFFYVREMERRGYTSAPAETLNVYLWNDGDGRLAVHVIVERVQSLVILASNLDAD